MTEPLRLSVVVDPEMASLAPDAVSFELGPIPTDVPPEFIAYEHHGEGYHPLCPGALTRLFEDLIMGRPFPLRMNLRQIGDVDAMVAVALFMSRDLAIHPAMPGLVASVDMVHRLGDNYLAHLDRDLERFIRLLRGYLPPRGLGRRETGERLSQVVIWIHEYVMGGRLPSLPVDPPLPRVIDIGTDGFVFAETPGPLRLGWVELYRMGHLRGLLLGPELGGRRHALAARKSPWMALDFDVAGDMLNQIEAAMGEIPGWRASDGLWLDGPEEGTCIRPTELLAVLTRA